MAFIAITAETYNQRLVLINTSTGQRLFDPNGIKLEDALDFLFGLRHLRKRKSSLYFITYGFSRDNEFLFSLLERELRDRLFQAPKIKERLSELEREQEELDEIFYNGSDDLREQADFERYVNRLAIRELTSVTFNGYDIRLANGKRLTIARDKKSITIYDIYGFFRPSPLRKAVKEYCGTDLQILDRNSLDDFELSKTNTLNAICKYSDIEADQIARLADALAQKLQAAGISLRRWHGATAITSWFLGKHKAKAEYHSYRHRRQLSPQMHLALHSAFFAGRAEQVKIGTLENVYTYDINSAYGYAASILPRMLTKPTYRTIYAPLPFSFWSVKFDFRGAGRRVGVFPLRGRGGRVTFPLTGNGFYWQPELDYALRYYPDCVEIGHGYALDAPQADFAAEIPKLYDLRLRLRAEGNPLQKVIKLALASIYGKFCQHNGTANFYNLFYAGFITAFVRRMLLDATHGSENAIVCFLTDCIHSTQKLKLRLDDELGSWREEKFAKIRYLDNGVYECYNEQGRAVKTKTKGFRSIRFDAAAFQLQRTKKFSTISEFFVGHNVYSQHIWESARYLENISVTKENQPLFGAGRRFDYEGENLLEHHVNSLPLVGDPQRQSLPYIPAQLKDADFGLDSIEARRRLC